MSIKRPICLGKMSKNNKITLKKCHKFGIITLENAQQEFGGSDDAEAKNRKGHYALD